MTKIGDDIVAIDTHIHLRDEVVLKMGSRSRDMARYFGGEPTAVPADELASMYRDMNMMAIIMNSREENSRERPGVPNDHIAQVVADDPDVFLGFGVIDPALGQEAVREIHRCKDELGLIGIGELNPARQRFQPNDEAYYPLWDAAQEAGLPVMFHGGYPAAGSRTPGGGGVKLKFSNPIHLDDIAADFPELTVICAHPSWPWESEALAMTLHKENVYMDLSGWAPRYMSDEVRTYVNSRIKEKVLFGSDWPGITPQRWLSEFEDLDIKPEVRKLVLLENAKKVFGLKQGTD